MLATVTGLHEAIHGYNRARNPDVEVQDERSTAATNQTADREDRITEQKRRH